MNVLTFSPSARKIWTQPQKKVLNHVYWLLPYLMGLASKDFNIYTIEKSFSPVANMKTYKGEKIDMIISLGAGYSPATLSAAYTKGFSRHERIFDIGDIVKRVTLRDKPLHVNLCVDVRKWFPSLTEILGTEPDIYLTEQDMKWQQVGYYYNNKVYSKKKRLKRERFFFAGGAKKRHQDFKRYMDGVKYPKVIHGGGWDKILNPEDGYSLHGFQHFIDSLNIKMTSKYGFVLHEPIGNEAGWITSKLFEYWGTDTVAFIANEYDKYNLYVPKDYKLRVNGSDQINQLIEEYGYEGLLKFQKELINPKWGDFVTWFYNPFKKRINEIWEGQKR